MIYDLIIIGLGPAGLTAGIYAARYKLKTLIIGRDLGQTAEAWLIENYPGFQDIKGMELIEKFKEHAEKLGVEIMQMVPVNHIKKENSIFVVKTGDDQEFRAKSIILAIGMQKRKMGIPGEKNFLGKGVSYCATCDAAFFNNKVVGVVGGSDSAATAALMLSEHAKMVYIIYRKDALRAQPAWVEKINKNPKIKTIFNAIPKELKGDDVLKSVVIERAGKTEEIALDGIFFEIGYKPETNLPAQLGVETDEYGHIKVKPDMSTNIEGVFAAGDVTTPSEKLRQIITASAEGAIAATSAYKYIKSKGGD